VNKKSWFLLCSLLFSLTAFMPRSLAFAQEAVIKELTGTVELKKAGAAEWENAAKGQSVAVDTVISTSFKSTAIISIGNSLITVRPLTLLTSLSPEQPIAFDSFNSFTGTAKQGSNIEIGGEMDFD